MRRPWVLMLVVGIAAGSLGGCASTFEAPSLARSPSERAFPIDTDYMQSVAAIARERGVDVRWVNPPRLRTTSGKNPR